MIVMFAAKLWRIVMPDVRLWHSQMFQRGTGEIRRSGLANFSESLRIL